jgi:hypothetical protein
MTGVLAAVIGTGDILDGIMTQGNNGPADTKGFRTTGGTPFGSISPAQILVTDWYDNYAFAQTGSTLVMAGFSSNPGQGFFSQATAAGTTLLSSAASYAYNAGVATWGWSNTFFGFAASGTTPVSIS